MFSVVCATYYMFQFVTGVITIRVKMVRHVHKKDLSIHVPARQAGLASFVMLKWFLARMQHSEKVTYRIPLGAYL